MLHISICDDEPIFIESLKKILETELMKWGLEYVFQEYNDGSSLLKNEEFRECELIFLDIQMPGVSGLEVAEGLMEKGQNKKIVFVTNYDYLVFPALKCHPFYFLRKNKISEEIQELIRQFLIQDEMDRRNFQYVLHGNIYNVPFSDIIYLVYYQHKITVFSRNKGKIEFRSSIKECEEQLNSDCFFRANQGTIINLKYCESYQGDVFKMQNGETIPVSRDRQGMAKKRFMWYWRNFR